MKKKLLPFIALSVVLVLSAALLFGCAKPDNSWRDKGYDLSLPNLSGLADLSSATPGTASQTSEANEDGWFVTLWDDFNGAGGASVLNASTIAYNDDGSKIDTAANPVWTTSPHNYRKKVDDPAKSSWWCPAMVSVKDGQVLVSAEQRSNHVCPNGTCPAVGRITGGIETREVVGDQVNNQGTSDKMLFSQAYGYFEARVKFPDAAGLWSAFWIQSSNQRNTAHEGVDGTEIDIYESAFYKNPSRMGNALLWNGYDPRFAKVEDYIADAGVNLYDDYHTFSLKWTPEYYVFYIDNQIFWATNGGGVAKVKEFLRLTVEIDEGDAYGPHGQKIGQFDGTSSPFIIDYVRVYQNKNYLPYVLSDSVFPGSLNLIN